MKKKLKKLNSKSTQNNQKSLSSQYDVNGAYTGTPAYTDHSAPTQDVDDLWYTLLAYKIGIILELFVIELVVDKIESPKNRAQQNEFAYYRKHSRPYRERRVEYVLLQNRTIEDKDYYHIIVVLLRQIGI